MYRNANMYFLPGDVSCKELVYKLEFDFLFMGQNTLKWHLHQIYIRLFATRKMPLEASDFVGVTYQVAIGDHSNSVVSLFMSGFLWLVWLNWVLFLATTIIRFHQFLEEWFNLVVWNIHLLVITEFIILVRMVGISTKNLCWCNYKWYHIRKTKESRLRRLLGSKQ